MAKNYKMNTKVREYLIDVARRRTDQTVNYQKLCDDCKLDLDMNNIADRNTLSRILEDISIYENKFERPLLSSLVVHLGDGQGGKGFFTLCEKLGFGSRDRLKKNLFEHIQIRKCIDFWTNDENYKAYVNTI